MKRLIAAFALAATAACADRNEQRFERLFEDGQVAMRRGQAALAEEAAARGAAETAAPSAAFWGWRFRLLRAEALIAQSKLADAASLLSEPPPAASEFDMIRARLEYVRARAALAQGRLPEALDLLDQASQRGVSDPGLDLDIDVLRGQLGLRLGQTVEAERRLSEAVDRAAAAGDRYRQALALNNLGMGRIVRNRFDEALPWFERVLSFDDLEALTVYAAALNNAGICYARLGQFDRAMAVQRRAVEIHERGGRTAEFGQALGELGGTHLLQGELSQALPYLKRALEVARAANLPADAALWATNLAVAHAELGEWDEAERFNDEAMRLNPSTAPDRFVYNTITIAQIAAARGRAADARQLYERVLTESKAMPVAQWWSYEELAKLAIAAGQLDRAARYYEAALDSSDQTRASLQRTDYKLSIFTRLINLYRDYVELLVGQGRIDQALEIADSSRGRVLAERHGVAVPAGGRAPSFRRLARQSGKILLSYWLAPERSLLWVVKGDAIRMLILPPEREIETLVREHQAAIDDTQADPMAAESPGGRLFDLLVKPALQWIEPQASLVIVPDGALHRLNFETLAVGAADRHYWIEDVEIQIAPSLAMLAAEPAPPPASPALLLVGNPSPREPEFPALRFASAEMAGITRHFSDTAVSIYEGGRASPAAYLAARPERFTLVHFTSHAVANTDSPLDSAIILAGPDHAFKLYARDVAAAPLSAELVTVSACRSAGERSYSGEGLVGFAWAFLRAGARRVVAGLWDVDDRSTAALMDRFYAGLAGGQPAAAALRAAKRALIAQGYAKPYYWAPLQLFSATL